jgi:hypothetical protein
VVTLIGMHPYEFLARKRNPETQKTSKGRRKKWKTKLLPLYKITLDTARKTYKILSCNFGLHPAWVPIFLLSTYKATLTCTLEVELHSVYIDSFRTKTKHVNHEIESRQYLFRAACM